ncbi:hypothetical protein [Aggregatilinea lenta]|uniref:hypothetical protein n=1 Tax=Aggregatilinea lenta TaxID=913108 RepID=UPI0013C33E99|nr:hypothetical protein [Aggregatilinea lenta]
MDYTIPLFLYDYGINKEVLTAGVRKVVTMVMQINPEAERIRAQAILRSFTEYDKAVELFAPRNSQAETTEPAANTTRSNGPFITRVFKSIKRNHRPAVEDAAQQPAYSPRPVTTSGCS